MRPDDDAGLLVEGEDAAAHARIVVYRGEADVDAAVEDEGRAPDVAALLGVAEDGGPYGAAGADVDGVDPGVGGAVEGEAGGGVHTDRRADIAIGLGRAAEAPELRAGVQIEGVERVGVGDV